MELIGGVGGRRKGGSQWRPVLKTMFLAVQESKVAVIVATVTDDVRLFEVPKLRVCALRFTETARARITKVGLRPNNNVPAW